MNAIEVEQRSEEWHQLRLGKITASKFKDVLASPATKEAREAGELSASAMTYMLELLAERLQAKFARDFKTADNIQMGLIDGGVFVNDKLKEWRADGVPFGSFHDDGGGGTSSVDMASEESPGWSAFVVKKVAETIGSILGGRRRGMEKACDGTESPECHPTPTPTPDSNSAHQDVSSPMSKDINSIIDVMTHPSEKDGDKGADEDGLKAKVKAKTIFETAVNVALSLLRMSASERTWLAVRLGEVDGACLARARARARADAGAGAGAGAGTAVVPDDAGFGPSLLKRFADVLEASGDYTGAQRALAQGRHWVDVDEGGERHCAVVDAPEGMGIFANVHATMDHTGLSFPPLGLSRNADAMSGNTEQHIVALEGGWQSTTAGYRGGLVRAEAALAYKASRFGANS